jgi:hypothetical protein
MRIQWSDFPAADRGDGISRHVIRAGVCFTPTTMSADYWNLTTMMSYSPYGRRSRWRLSTHFRGEWGSFYNTYRLNESVPELLGVSVLLDGRVDAFRGDCPRCGALFEISARIVKGRVATVWIVQQIEILATTVTGSATRDGG